MDKHTVHRKSFILIFSVFLFLLFGLKDILILTSKTWPHLYSVVNTSTLTYEEVYNYLPVFTGTSDLAESAPMPGTDQKFDRLSFFPALTVRATNLLP